MGADSKIEWTHHTFNPWWGCTRVSPGCERCYAETFAKRTGLAWGPQAERRFFGEKHWAEPLKWNAAAERDGVRRRVFCASMADVFEDRPELQPWREKLWSLVDATRSLDWLLLTKRPQNMRRMLPWRWLNEPRPNVWLGTTVEDQRRAGERIPQLLATPAAVRFLSCEPLLDAVDLDPWLYAPSRCRGCGSSHARYDTNPAGLPVLGTCSFGAELTGEPGAVRCAACGSLDVDELPPVDWVIVGGESGPGARPFVLQWARSIVVQCRAAGTACFVKQLGALPVEYAEPTGRFRTNPRTGSREYQINVERLPLRDRKGGDMQEWPEDLRVREFPRVEARP